MSFIADRVLDLGLTVLDAEATHLYICSSEPTSYAAAVTAKLGTQALAAGGIGAPAARSPDGRKVTVAAITAGSVTATGTGSHYAIVDETNSRLLATNSVTASQVLTAGNTFSTAAFDIGIPGAV